MRSSSVVDGGGKLTESVWKPPTVTGISRLSGTSSGNLGRRASSKFFWGLRDDPFFFDEAKIRASMVTPGPPITRIPGLDSYSGLNCSIVAVELPAAVLKGTANNQINFWATVNVPTSVARTLKVSARGEPLEGKESTSKSFVQHDRAALAVVSTFFVREEDKNTFCAGQPKDEAKFFMEPAKALIERLQPSPMLRLPPPKPRFSSQMS